MLNISQQGMTIVSLQAGAKGRKLSDIEFLSIKEHEGKIKSDQGAITSVGDLATLTAAAGKDMYLGTAKCAISGNDINDVSVTVELSINGVVIETYRLDVEGGAGNGLQAQSYEFKNIGRKVTTGQIIKLEVTNETNGLVRGYIECFEEDTDDSPQIPSI